MKTPNAIDVDPVTMRQMQDCRTRLPSSTEPGPRKLTTFFRFGQKTPHFHIASRSARPPCNPPLLVQDRPAIIVEQKRQIGQHQSTLAAVGALRIEWFNFVVFIE
jgi:hypothetical protein